MRRNFRILVVEADPTDREAAAVLERLGHSFDVASGWRGALELLSDVPYALVLMDCRMPEIDGFELTRIIRDPEANVAGHCIPVVAMLAHVTGGDRERCLAAGMNDYVAKPIRPEVLEQTIQRWAAAAAGFDGNDLIERLMGSENLARRVASRFLEDMPRQLIALSQALTGADAESARRLAHSIKGAAANVSVEPVRGLAERLEELGKEGRLADAAELLPELVSTFDGLIPAMRRFCAT
jgi:CheY-like chemotaxis protein